MAPEREEVLRGIGQSRRDFLRGVIAGAAFAPPLVVSFSMNGLSLHASQAVASNQLVCSNITSHIGAALFLRKESSQLVLDAAPPTSTKAAFKDSPGLSKARGNPFRVIGTWTSPSVVSSTDIVAVDPAVLPLGLKNSDDQGTAFDVLVELLLGSVVIASGSDCIEDLTRNPTLAQCVGIALTPTGTAASGMLALRISARISESCPGHSAAQGVRLYFDAIDRPAQVGVEVGPC
jgi:hypothetical protein